MILCIDQLTVFADIDYLQLLYLQMRPILLNELHNTIIYQTVENMF